MIILRKIVESQRQYYIDQLLKIGVYKIRGFHLYKLTLRELKTEFLFHTRDKLNTV